MRDIRIQSYEYDELLKWIHNNEYIDHFNLGLAFHQNIGEVFTMPRISEWDNAGNPVLDYSFAPIAEVVEFNFYKDISLIPDSNFVFSFLPRDRNELRFVLQKRYAHLDDRDGVTHTRLKHIGWKVNGEEVWLS